LLKSLYHIGIQPWNTLNRSHHLHLFRQSRVECLSDLLWLTDTTTLYDDVVELLQLSQTDEFF
jgi:hypothetical protein